MEEKKGYIPDLYQPTLRAYCMGEIMEVNESATTVTYKIDDCMGPWVDVLRWIDQQVC